MADIPLRRRDVGHFFDEAGEDEQAHAGLLLAKGFAQWRADPTKKGEDLQKLLQRVTALPAPKIYGHAYERWRKTLAENPAVAYWPGRLTSRLFIGLGGASVLETAISLSRSYGLPLIPGSALKGLACAYANAGAVADVAAREALFGKAGDTPDSADAGYVLFHDAWWIPEPKQTPLTPEIVTVHHQDYYGSSGQTPATDFDSPVPAGQIAAQGSFLFAVECADPAWAEAARDLLVRALGGWGIGGKTAAGYGRIKCQLDTQPHDPLSEFKTWFEAQGFSASNKGTHNAIIARLKELPDIAAGKAFVKSRLKNSNCAPSLKAFINE